MDIKKVKFEKKQILMLFLAGVLLLIIAMPTKKRQDTEKSSIVSENEASGSDMREYTEYLEKNLEEAISQMEGAGEVAVMVTLASSAEQIVEKDLEINDELITETDSQGGTRTTNNSGHGETTIYQGEGADGEAPYVTKEISPKVEGVVVIAEGGDNAVVAKNIMESIQALFGIETHKIRIVKKGG